VTGRRNSKRLSNVLRCEYRAAMSMLEADFSGEERDYTCAAADFKRQSPLDCDLYSAADVRRHRTPTRSQYTTISGVQAAAR